MRTLSCMHSTVESGHKDCGNTHLAPSLGVFSRPLGICACTVCHLERLEQPGSCMGFRTAHSITENPKSEASLGFLLRWLPTPPFSQVHFLSSPGPSSSLVLLISSSLARVAYVLCCCPLPRPHLRSHHAMGFL